MQSIRSLKQYIRLILESTEEDVIDVVFDIFDPIKNTKMQFYDQLVSGEERVKFGRAIEEKELQFVNSLTELLFQKQGFSIVGIVLKSYLEYAKKEYVKGVIKKTIDEEASGGQHVRDNIQRNLDKINALIDNQKNLYVTAFNSLSSFKEEDILSLADELKTKLNDKLMALAEKIVSNELWTILNRFTLVDNLKFLKEEDNLTISILRFCNETYQDLTGDKIFSFISKNIVDEYNSNIVAFNVEDVKEKYVNSVDQAIIVVNKIIKKIDKDQQSDKAEAPPGAPLGKIAFSTDRKRVPLERNTKVEDELLDGIRDHFGKSVPISKEDAKLIKNFISQNIYQKIFSEPRSESVFRGMSVSKGYLAKILGTDEIPDSGNREVNYTFKPLRGVNSSSWSTSKRIAKKFSTGSVLESYELIMHAKTSENADKFLDGDGLYDIESIKGYNHEKEVIGFGNIVVHKVEWKKTI